MRWMIVFLAACSFPDRTSKLTCDTADDCTGDRVCIRGYCVAGDVEEIDAPITTIDAPNPDASMIDAAPLACDTTNLSCPGGSATAAMCNGHCWVGCSALLQQSSAAASCTTWGGEATPLRDIAADTACARDRIPLGQRLWLGLVQPLNQAQPDDGWKWGAGDLLGANNWLSGKPDDSDDNEDNMEQCAFLSESSTTWDDKSCATPYAFTCRR